MRFKIKINERLGIQFKKDKNNNINDNINKANINKEE